jgi:hypothetical protein
MERARNLPVAQNVKIGGNVASYFCTPDLEVIHAVAGPAEAADFLEQARRALDWAGLFQDGSLDEARSALAWHHARQAETVPGRCRSRSAGAGGGARRAVHERLQEAPLPALEDLYRFVFERVLSEEVSDRDVEVREEGWRATRRSLR